MTLDIKQKIRHQKIYSLWLNGKTAGEIVNLLAEEGMGASKRTVERDLIEIQKEIEIAPIDYNAIRQEAMQSLRVTKLMILESLKNVKIGSSLEQKLLKTLGDIDVGILGRNSPPSIGRQYNLQVIKQEALTVAKFVTEQHPELVGEFKQYIEVQKKGAVQNPT